MKQGREIKRYKLQAVKSVSHGYEMYSIGNIVKIVQYLCMVTDGIQTHCGDRFGMYRSIDSLCCKSGTNIRL